MAGDKIDKSPAASVKKVRGLLDVVEAEARGEAWELETLSAGFVPGMGLGATKEATRWAWLGIQSEMASAIDGATKRPAHRPQKHPYETNDAVRAFAVWRICKVLRETLDKPKAKITTRELIRLIQLVEESLGVNGHEKLFKHNEATNEQSVARGKKHLEIDAGWNSNVCEELWRTFPQTT